MKLAFLLVCSVVWMGLTGCAMSNKDIADEIGYCAYRGLPSYTSYKNPITGRTINIECSGVYLPDSVWSRILKEREEHK